MRLLFLSTVLSLAAGCQDACEAQCASLDEFFEACAPELEDAGVLLVCYDDEVEAFKDGSIDPTDARACTDGTDYRQSCLRVSHAQANALSPQENGKRLQDCEDPTEWDQAVAAGDCEAAAGAWSGREDG